MQNVWYAANVTSEHEHGVFSSLAKAKEWIEQQIRYPDAVWWERDGYHYYGPGSDNCYAREFIIDAPPEPKPL